MGRAQVTGGRSVGAAGDTSLCATAIQNLGNPFFIEDSPGAGSYVNESNWFDRNWAEQYWGGHYDALSTIKRRIDPTGLF